MSIHQVVVVFHICKIVVDTVIDESDLHLFTRAGLLQPHKISKVIIHEILGCCEPGRVCESTHVVITTNIDRRLSWRVYHLCLTLVVAALPSPGYQLILLGTANLQEVFFHRLCFEIWRGVNGC